MHFIESRTVPCNPVRRIYIGKNLYCLLCRSRYVIASQKIFTILFLLSLLWSHMALQAQRLSRDQAVVMLTNQVGYLPSSTKTCLIKGTGKRDFEVIEITSGLVTYRGTLISRQDDFGTYLTADFSKVVKEGRYYLRADTIRSFPFSISKAVYQPEMNMIVGY